MISDEECEQQGGHYWKKKRLLLDDEQPDTYVECINCGIVIQNISLFPNNIISYFYTINPQNLESNPIIQLLLKKLPEGERNCVLWFSFKCLWSHYCQHYNTEYYSTEFNSVHRRIETIQRGSFPENRPSNEYIFNPQAVNNWCRKNHFNPIFLVLAKNVIPRSIYNRKGYRVVRK